MRSLVAWFLIPLVLACAAKDGAGDGGSGDDSTTDEPVATGTLYLGLYDVVLQSAGLSAEEAKLVTDHVGKNLPEKLPSAPETDAAALLDPQSDAALAAAKLSFRQDMASGLCVGVRAVKPADFLKSMPIVALLSEFVQTEFDKVNGTNTDLKAITPNVSGTNNQAAVAVSDAALGTVESHLESGGADSSSSSSLYLQGTPTLPTIKTTDVANILASVATCANRAIDAAGLPAGTIGVATNADGTLKPVGALAPLFQQTLNTVVKILKDSGSTEDATKASKEFIESLTNAVKSQALANGNDAASLTEITTGLKTVAEEHNKTATGDQKVDVANIEATMAETTKVASSDAECKWVVSNHPKYAPVYESRIDVHCKNVPWSEEVRDETLYEVNSPITIPLHFGYIDTNIVLFFQFKAPVPGDLLPDGFKITLKDGAFTAGTPPKDGSHVYIHKNPAPARTIGGTVAGFSGTLVLQNNGGEKLTITKDGAYTFPTSITSGTGYDVKVFTQPSGKSCTVAKGKGTATANVTDIDVTCASLAKTVGGTVTSLEGSVKLQLLSNNNTLQTDVIVNADGAFTFPQTISVGEDYEVTVMVQPAGTEVCTVSNGVGNVTANVINVGVHCITYYTLGVSVTGLTNGYITVRDFYSPGGSAMDRVHPSVDGNHNLPGTRGEGHHYDYELVTINTTDLCDFVDIIDATGDMASNVLVAITCTAGP